MVLSILAAFMLSHSVTPARAVEPSLEEILGNLGFTNITESTVETFPAGLYEITLYAEFAGYHDTNELSYYPVATSDFTILFSGPEGNSGCITPPIAKTFLCNSTFGLSMYVAHEGYRYFTENLMSPDGQDHSKIFLNLDEPDMYLCGFENLYGLCDRDSNDMVFSLRVCMHGTCVGGSSISIGSNLLSGWINLNVVLIAAVFITASWIKRRRKTC